MPKGRRCATGQISDELMARYKYVEHTSAEYPPRTEANVRDSDVTIWFGRASSPGFYCTRKAALKWGKAIHVNPPKELLQMLARTHEVWNVAGNREHTNAGLFDRTVNQLMEALLPMRDAA